MKKYFLIFSLLVFSYISFSQSYVEKFICSYSGNENLEMEIMINFNVENQREILTRVYFIKNRYFLIKIEKPELFSGILYLYDLHEKDFLTKYDNEIDKYSEISLLTASIPSFINRVLLGFSPDKFIMTSETIGSYFTEKYVPKTKNAMKLFNIDYTIYNFYFLKNDDYFYLKNIKILNSTEKKEIDLSINYIGRLDSEDAYKLINDFFE